MSPPIPCFECRAESPNFFANEQALEEHIFRAHLKHEPWICSLCPDESERFFAERHLIEHYERGHGARDYEVISFTPVPELWLILLPFSSLSARPNRPSNAVPMLSSRQVS